MRSEKTGRPAEPVERESHPDRRPQVIAGVVGFLIGSGVLGGLWALSGVHTGPLDDAKAACAALDRAGDLPFLTDAQVATGAPPLAPGVLERVTAAKDLAAAAAGTDPSYQALADHMDGVERMVTGLHFNDLSGQRHLAQARQLCSYL